MPSFVPIIRDILQFVVILPLIFCALEGDMPHGTGTTLEINPTGGATLVMQTANTTPGASAIYIVPLQSLDLHENARWQTIHDQGPPGEGGEAVGEYSPLVPVTFQVIIKSPTIAGRVDAYNDLQGALLNRKGGTIKYKPDGVGDSVLDTYYHYVQSSPPRVLDSASNRWDAGTTSDGYYTLVVDVEFMTQPIATSDPDSPVTLADMADTLENWVDTSPVQDNSVTVDADNLKGSLPALVRIKARPGSGQHLGRLIIFKRDEGTLANFIGLYEAEDASEIYPGVGWSSVADADRGDGNYMRCLPPEDANGVAQGLRFTLVNPSDHEGRFAVFGVSYDDANATEVWTHQVKVKVGNIIQEGEADYAASMLHYWSLFYAGEFELPPTPLSDVVDTYDAGPYIEWHATRASGTSEFRLDAILLVYVADSDDQPTALDIICSDETGVSSDEKLLIENFPGNQGVIREIAQVVNQANDRFVRALMTAPCGDFMMLDPAVDAKIVFIQERAGEVLLDDDFSSYKASRWMPLEDFEDLSEWTLSNDATQDSTYELEDDNALKLVDPSAGETTAEVDVAWDLEADGRFTNLDFIVFVYHASDTAQANRYLYARFYTGAAYYQFAFSPGDNGVFSASEEKIGAGQSDFPDWADIDKFGLRFFGSRAGDAATYVCLDHLRIEKADPDDAEHPNPTGTQWDFQPVGGLWGITEDISGAGATLACFDQSSGDECVAIIDETTTGDIQFRARVMAKRDAGYAGILWRAGDDTLTAGAEDTYAAMLDIGEDKLLIREYVAGAITEHDNPAFTCAVDTWYVVGVIMKGSTFKVYATAAPNLSDDGDVFDESYLLSTVTDSTLASGKCGVISASTLGRFNNAYLVSLQDQMIPADTITVEGQAIFRTIAPFSE